MTWFVKFRTICLSKFLIGLKILFFYLLFQVKKSYPMIKETGLNALLQKPKISKSNTTQFLDASVPWDLRKIRVIFGMTPVEKWFKWPLLTSKEANSMELLGKQNINSCFLRRPQKITKSSPSIWHLLGKRQIDGEDFVIFYGLFRKHEL